MARRKKNKRRRSQKFVKCRNQVNNIFFGYAMRIQKVGNLITTGKLKGKKLEGNQKKNILES